MNRKAVLIFFAGFLTACLTMVGIGGLWVYAESRRLDAEVDKLRARAEELHQQAEAAEANRLKEHEFVEKLEAAGLKKQKKHDQDR